jgi:lysozyme
MQQKQSKLLFRLIATLAVLGFSFWLCIWIIGYFRHYQPKQVSEKHKTFGIVLPANYAVHGIDVSRHQSDIEWDRVEKMKSDSISISFVFIKAAEGITRQDPAFERNWESIRKTGMLRGAYHFYYPSRDAKKQARNFISQVKLGKGDLPPVADIEHSNGKSRKKICEGLHIFLDELEKKYKVRPIIYTNLSFYNTYLHGDFDDYPLWISCYFEEERFYANCSHKWTFWQHSEKGKADGIAGNVDFNVFNGTLQDLKKLCIQ